MIAPITEQVIAKEFFIFGCGFQETGWYNLICIYIFQRQGDAGACYDIEVLFHDNFVYINSLGSVITPVTAAAAAVNGEASKVRDPGP